MSRYKITILERLIVDYDHIDRVLNGDTYMAISVGTNKAPSYWRKRGRRQMLAMLAMVLPSERRRIYRRDDDRDLEVLLLEEKETFEKLCKEFRERTLAEIRNLQRELDALSLNRIEDIDFDKEQEFLLKGLYWKQDDSVQNFFEQLFGIVLKKAYITRETPTGKVKFYNEHRRQLEVDGSRVMFVFPDGRVAAFNANRGSNFNIGLPETLL